METQESKKSDYVAYEYLSVNVNKEFAPIYTDCYENLGWQNIISLDNENIIIIRGKEQMVNLRFRRARKIKNRSMLVSLQKKCENALRKINKLEKSKETGAMIASLTIGATGLSFLIGGIFSFLSSKTAMVVVSFLLACIGFVFPYYTYKKMRISRDLKVAPLIEEQYDLIYEVCEQARILLA